VIELVDAADGSASDQWQPIAFTYLYQLFMRTGCKQGGVVQWVWLLASVMASSQAHLSGSRVNLAILRESYRRELLDCLDKCQGSKVSSRLSSCMQCCWVDGPSTTKYRSVKTLRTRDTSDPRHFSTRQHWTKPWQLRNNSRTFSCSLLQCLIHVVPGGLNCIRNDPALCCSTGVSS